MALRVAMAKNLKGLTQQLVQSRGIGTSTTRSGTPKMQPYAPTMEREPTRHPTLWERLFPKGKPVGDYVPVYMALGMISLSVTLGLYTAKQHLMHAPDVRVKKSMRETVPEVVEPEEVAREAENFIKKSFFRKVAHVQEFEKPVGDPIHGNPLTREPRVESLKTVGVDPVVVDNNNANAAVRH